MRRCNLEFYNKHRLCMIERRSRFSASLLRVLNDVVSEVFSVPVSDILSSKRGERRVSDARMCVMWHLRRDARMGWSEIGSLVGRAHASVIHAVGEYEEMARIGLDREFSLRTARVNLALSLSVPYTEAVKGYRECFRTV